MSKDLSTSTFSLTLTYFWKLTSNRDIAVSFVRDAAAGAIGAPSATMEAMVVCLWHQRFKGPLVFRPNPRRTIRTAHAVAVRKTLMNSQGRSEQPVQRRTHQAGQRVAAAAMRRHDGDGGIERDRRRAKGRIERPLVGMRHRDVASAHEAIGRRVRMMAPRAAV